MRYPRHCLAHYNISSNITNAIRFSASPTLAHQPLYPSATLPSLPRHPRWHVNCVAQVSAPPSLARHPRGPRRPCRPRRPRCPCRLRCSRGRAAISQTPREVTGIPSLLYWVSLFVLLVVTQICTKTCKIPKYYDQDCRLLFYLTIY